MDVISASKSLVKYVKLIQTGDRSTSHMVYVGWNKLKLHLEGNDVDSNGNPISIEDRHEGISLLFLDSIWL